MLDVEAPVTEETANGQVDVKARWQGEEERDDGFVRRLRDLKFEQKGHNVGSYGTIKNSHEPKNHVYKLGYNSSNSTNT